MPIVDFIFDKLEANRSSKKIGPTEIKISNNFGLKEVTKEKIPGLGDCVITSFEFKTDYEPDLGNIIIQGRVIYHDKNLKNVVKEEKGNLVLKEQAFEDVNNAVLRSSTIQALVLSKEMRLPSPVQLPKVSLQEPPVKKK